MQGKQPTIPGLSSIEGTITLPQDSKIVYIGAVPPNGEMLAYAEVSDIEAPLEDIDVVVLQDGHTIPGGYEYLGYILAVPILFIYKKVSKIALN